MISLNLTKEEICALYDILYIMDKKDTSLNKLDKEYYSLLKKVSKLDGLVHEDNKWVLSYGSY